MHLNSLVQRTLFLHGHRPALARGYGTPVSYQELGQRISALAGWLRNEKGLQPGDRVVIAMKNSIEYAEILLACWHGGLCAVPVNSKLHLNELGYILEDSGASICFSSGSLCRDLQSTFTQTLSLDCVDINSETYRGALTHPDIPPFSGTGEETAWLFYTSGTTGRPKGVMISHDNLVAMSANFFADIQPVTSTDVIAHVAPMSHGSGLYAIPYLIQGALQVIPESGGFDEAELMGIFQHYASISLFVAPTILQRLIQHVESHGSAFPGLRTMIVGGAPFYVEDIKAAVNCFGPRIAQIYGQGESPMSITALSAQQIADALEQNDTELLASVGTRQFLVYVDILDETGKSAQPGELGEVVVCGPTVMKGYWNNPEATAQTVKNGWLYTGDVGVFDKKGRLQLRDRSKDVIISGGVNIYPREVEEVLLQHSAIKEISVIGLPDREWGESIAAFVVCHPGMVATTEELEALCLKSIARFKRPKQYFFTDSLPKNGTGKILKTELRKIATTT